MTLRTLFVIDYTTSPVRFFAKQWATLAEVLAPGRSQGNPPAVAPHAALCCEMVSPGSGLSPLTLVRSGVSPKVEAGGGNSLSGSWEGV